MTAEKGKKQKVAAENGEEQIDGELVLSIEKLQEIQDELEKINEKASDEVLEVERKYIHLRKPVYDIRKEIIQSIPEFWLTAFLRHPSLSQILTDEDQKIFKYLESLEVEESKDIKMDYTISFNFNANPYFENSKLSKTFHFLDEGVVKVRATPIKWKEGKGISNGAKDEKKGNKRPLDEESFFSWFEESEELEEMTDQIADIIKEDLWPNPLGYFNNEGEYFDDEDEDSEDDNDDDDDDDDDDEE